MTDYETISRQIADQFRRQGEANTVNQRVIMDALAALGIASLEVSFDGYGDSGQINDVAVNGGSGALTGEVPVALSPWSGDEHQASRTKPLAEAIEDLCYGLLEQTAGGWENNDGAFGTFTFDIASRSIELEFNGRYESYDTSHRSFTAEG